MPVKHALPRFQELQIKEIRQENSRGVIGAKYGDEGQVVLYLRDNNHGAKKVTYDCQTAAKLKENHFSVNCTQCRKHKADLTKVVVHGDYILTCEVCPEDSCQQLAASKKNHQVQVVVARKRSELGKFHVVYTFQTYGNSGQIDIEVNDSAVLLHDQSNKILVFQHWNHILTDKIKIVRPTVHASPSPYRCFFLCEDDYGYLISASQAKIPGMPPLHLPDQKTSYYYSIQKLSSIRFVAAVKSSGKETSDLVLFDQNCKEISRLAGKFYGWRDIDDTYGNDKGPWEPSFSKLKLVAPNILLVLCSHTYFHVVLVNKDSLTMLKEELELLGNASMSTIPILDWDLKRKSFIARWFGSDLIFLVSIMVN